MSERRKSLLDAVLAHSPAQFLFQWRAARQLTVLAYHGIDDPDRFEQHLAYIVKTMQPVTLNEVLAAVAGQGGLPPRAVLITFDDGERSLREVGLPLLKEYGLPGVAFIVAGYLDTNRPFWWIEVDILVRNGAISRQFPNLTPTELVSTLKQVPDKQRLQILAELRESNAGVPPTTPQLSRTELVDLESAGVVIGNHTLTHPCLPNCDKSKIEHEVTKAHKTLTEALGQSPRSFAYPNGDADDQVMKVLAELEYQAAFLFDHRHCSLPVHNPCCISRLRVNSNTSIDRFQVIVSGLHPAIYQTRQTLKHPAKLLIP